jgi:hypothetical protein
MIVARLTLTVLTAFAAVPVLAQSGDNDFTTPRPRGGVVVPGAYALAVADEPPKLGVMVSDSDDGVVISEIFDGSLASSAGLQAGDVLFRLAGQRVNTVSDIPGALAEHTEPGGKVAITVIREGEGLVTLHGERARPAPPVVEHHEEHGDGGTWVSEGEHHAGGAFLGIGLGGDSEHGPVVSSIYDNTAAWFVGLEEGDILTRVGKIKCSTGEEVAQAVGAHSAGDMVNLRWVRGDRVFERDIRLGHRLPENPLGMVLPGMIELEDVPFLHGSGFETDGPFGMHFEGEHPIVIQSDGSDIAHWLELGDKMKQRVKLGQDGGSMTIEIKNGQVLLNNDGELQVIEIPQLDGVDAAGAAFQFLHNDDGNLSVLPFGDASYKVEVKSSECSEAQAPECGEAKAECEDAAASECCDESADECCDEATECEEVEDDDSIS